MINTVHGKKLLVCQWTGETIEKRFRIPNPKNKGWTGCYGSPSACLSAMAQVGEKQALDPEYVHEMIDTFESTIRREPGMEEIKFTIVPAPAYTLLKDFGGKKDLAEFHETYDHDTQVKLYFQEIRPSDVIVPDMPLAVGGAPMDGADFEEFEEVNSGRPANAPKRWRMTRFLPLNGRQPEEQTRYMLPRCAPSWMEFFKVMAARTHCKDAVIVYLHPHSDTVFGIGNPEDWQGEGNKSCSEVMGKIVTFGPVTAFHKNKIRETPKKTTKSKSDSTKKDQA